MENGTTDAADVTIADIVAEPTAYYSATVTVESDIDRIISPSVFTIDEEAALAAGVDNDLMVIAADANAFALDDGWLDDRVLVTGTVRPLVIAEFEREFGFDLSPELEVEFEDRPVIIATTVLKAE